MKIFEGGLRGDELNIAIVLSRFNGFITDKLLSGAVDCLTRHGVEDDNITVVMVPGAFEIPFTANRLVNCPDFDGILCLGAIIRGETPHFEYVAAECSKGIGHVALHSPIPVIYGVLTCDTVEQAIDRAGTKAGNKGFEAAMSLLEMVGVNSHLMDMEDSCSCGYDCECDDDCDCGCHDNFDECDYGCHDNGDECECGDDCKCEEEHKKDESCSCEGKSKTGKKSKKES